MPRGAVAVRPPELGFAYMLPDGAPFPAGTDRIRWPDAEPEAADYPETLPTW